MLSGCFHATRRWCPECYKRDASERYDLLAWQMATVSHCPLDGRRLECACWNCGLAQNDFLPVDQRNRCRTCLADLGAASVASEPPSRWENWANAASMDLLEFTSKAPTPIRGNPWRDFLEGLMESENIPAEKNLASFRPYTWRAQRIKPRMKTVFQYAALNCVTPLQVLLDPKGASSPTLSLASSVVDPPRPGNPSVRIWLVQRAAAALAANADTLDLPLPGWLAKAFGCTIPAWVQSDPAGYRQYCAAYRGPRVPLAVERQTFDSAVRLAEGNILAGGGMTVAELRADVAQRVPAALPATISVNVSRALTTVGMVRHLSPGAPVILKLVRERAMTFGRTL